VASIAPKYRTSLHLCHSTLRGPPGLRRRSDQLAANVSSRNRGVPLPAFLPINVLLLGDTHAAAEYRIGQRSGEIAPLIVAAKKA
jgi:hypothetical protein